MKYILSFLLSVVISTSAIAQFGDFDKTKIKTTKVRDSIYMLEGQGGNIGVSVGKDGLFIIDNQFTPLYEKIATALAELSEQPVNFVVNTHWHFDHTGGNVPFGSNGALIVSQQNSRDRMMNTQVLKAFNYTQEAYPEAGLPKITFDDEMWFHYNDDTIQLIHNGPAHTNGDTMVYFHKNNVLHTGDVFVTSGLPFIDAPNGGSIKGIISSVEAAMEIINDETVVIPGHGSLATREDMIQYRDVLATIVDRVAAEMAKEKSLDEIDPDKVLAGFPKGFLPPELFVAVVYQELAQ